MYSINFDPFFKEDTDGKLHRVDQWPHNYCQVTYPQNILSSDMKKVIEVSSYNAVIAEK